MIPLSFIWVFVVTMAIGLPIVFALSLAPIFGFLVADKAFFLQTLPQKLYIGINQFWVKMCQQKTFTSHI